MCEEEWLRSDDMEMNDTDAVFIAGQCRHMGACGGLYLLYTAQSRNEALYLT